jgi:putative flippase GtrA
MASMLERHTPLLFQLVRFGLVGVTAAAIHFAIVVGLVQTLAYEPLVANMFAFLVSFQVSYFGHRRFTFNGTAALHSVAFPKLLSLQIFNFVANESMFYFLLSLHLPYQMALLIVLATLPLFTFAVSKFWVFNH